MRGRQRPRTPVLAHRCPAANAGSVPRPRKPSGDRGALRGWRSMPPAGPAARSPSGRDARSGPRRACCSARRGRHRPRPTRRRPRVRTWQGRPMPTDCEPWPGKTKATDDIGPERGQWLPGTRIRVHACTHDRHPRAGHDPAGSPTRDRPAFRGGPLGAGARSRDTPANVRQISERVAMGRALWRELVIGFASPAR